MFNQPLFDGHLDCFQVFAITNKTNEKSGVYAFLCILSGLYSKVKFLDIKLLDQRVCIICIFNFNRLCQIMSISIEML